LRRDRAYAITVIATLALTIGATTAVFSIVNGVLLKPLPYPDPHRLVALREVWREFAGRYPTLDLNERHLEYWREHARSFEGLAQYTRIPANLTGRGEAAQILVVRSSGSLFGVLGVRAAIGRTLTPMDEPEGAPDVVTLADGLWRERFGADPAAVGTSIVLDGRTYTVVGVLPADFRLPLGGQLTAAVDAFVPARITVGWVGDHNDEGVGRLRDGMSIRQAIAELDALQAQVSEIATTEGHETVTLASSVTPLAERIVSTSRRGLLLLLAAVLAVLLIACANLANLSLTRALGRVRESAIRSALGAGRRRLMGRAILEQLLLAAVGGALGIWIAWLALGLFVRTAPVDLPRADEVALDTRVLAFAAVVSVLAGVLVAILPAWRIANGDVQGALRATSGTVASDRGALRNHAVLLTLQVGLSVMLLVVTALLLVSFTRVLNADRGFNAERVLAVDVALPAARYAAEAVRQRTYDRLLAAIQALPGVEGASTTSTLPLRGESQVNVIVPEGTARLLSQLPTANFRFVGPDYFKALGIVVRRGRSFAADERDPQRPAPALVSEPTAEKTWPGQDPIGRRFSRGFPNEQGFEVVGVVTESRTTSLDRAQPLMVYVPYWWRSRPTMSVLVRTAGDPSSLVPSVRRVVREIDPEIAVGESRTLERLVDASLAGRRYQTQLFVTFGLVALFIAIVGVYAVATHGVSRRRKEMTIRVALGAQPSQVVRMIVRQGMTPVLVGVLVGVAGALAMGGLVASLLFDVRARDPIVIAAVVALVGLAGLLTCAFAARRGLSIDPAAALRAE
jgi:putative ABC transport system permease protein